eukprot:m.1214596 g.1214596  ORF g.1214596 m.1214596 type:complete len:335 (+) comp24604_c0_seq2:505-1509(+)
MKPRSCPRCCTQHSVRVNTRGDIRCESMEHTPCLHRQELSSTRVQHTRQVQRTNSAVSTRRCNKVYCIAHQWMCTACGHPNCVCKNLPIAPEFDAITRQQGQFGTRKYLNCRLELRLELRYCTTHVPKDIKAVDGENLIPHRESVGNGHTVGLHRRYSDPGRMLLHCESKRATVRARHVNVVHGLAAQGELHPPSCGRHDRHCVERTLVSRVEICLADVPRPRVRCPVIVGLMPLAQRRDDHVAGPEYIRTPHHVGGAVVGDGNAHHAMVVLPRLSRYHPLGWYASVPCGGCGSIPATSGVRGDGWLGHWPLRCVDNRTSPAKPAEQRWASLLA